MSKSWWFAERFPYRLKDSGVSFEREGTRLKITALHAGVGDLFVAFDDNEITIFVGDVTHRHFTPYTGGVDVDEYTAEECLNDAVEYVRGLVNDEWVIWIYPEGGGGTYKIGLEDDPMQDAPMADVQVIRHLWSTPKSQA